MSTGRRKKPAAVFEPTEETSEIPCTSGPELPAIEETDEDPGSLAAATAGLRVAASSTSPVRMGQFLSKPKRALEDDCPGSPSQPAVKKPRTSMTELKEALNGFSTVLQAILTTCQKVEAQVTRLLEERTPRAVQGPVFPPVFSATMVPPTRLVTSGTNQPPTPSSAVANVRAPEQRSAGGPSGLSNAGNPSVI